LCIEPSKLLLRALLRQSLVRPFMLACCYPLVVVPFELKFDTWVLYAFAAVLRSILLMWRHMRFPDTSGSS
jgi:hypothetical protein